MPQRHEHHTRVSRREQARKLMLRVQQGFERGFNQFRDRYGALLEQAIIRRRALITLSLAIAVS
jgi:hypothetical protein